MNPALFHATPPQRRRLLALEADRRASGAWGDWQVLDVKPESGGPGDWLAEVRSAARNHVFAVLRRECGGGVIHLAVSSLSQKRPTWWEMQRIKNELAGEAATAIEVYPPQPEVVDGADMFHIWVLPGPLPFGLWDAARPRWQKVIFASDCDADGNCPACGRDYTECGHIGPTEEDVDYEERPDGLYGRRRAAGTGADGAPSMRPEAPTGERGKEGGA